MLPNGGYFKSLLCPFGAECSRAHCQFGLHQNSSSAAVERSPVASSDIKAAAVRTKPTYSDAEFHGYQGFFANTDPPKQKAPSKKVLLPTPAVSKAESKASRQSGVLINPTPDLNKLARDLASINNEIDELQKKLARTRDGNGDDEVVAPPKVKTIPVRGRRFSTDSSSDEQYRPKSTAESVSKVYKPTPIETLKKLDSSKNKLLKDGTAALLEETKPIKSASNKAVVANKSAELLSKKNKSGASLTSLFGDDSNDESPALTSKAKAKASRRNLLGDSKADKMDMSDILADIVPISSDQTVVEKRKVTTNDNDGEDLRKKKRRVVEQTSTSVEVVKKLRESGGERSKGQLPTAKQQLQNRFNRIQQLKNETEGKPMSAEKAEEIVSKQEALYGSAAKLKGDKRVAHTPKPSSAPSAPAGKKARQRPTIQVEVGGKVPASVRQRYLDLIIDEYLKHYTEEEAFAKALEDERAVYSKSASKPGYLNAIVNTVKRVRDQEAQASSVDGSCNMQTKQSAMAAVSHMAVIGGKRATQHSFTVGRSKSSGSNSMDRTGEEFYEALLPFVATIEQQQANGYPRPDPEKPGWAVFQKDEIRKMFVSDFEFSRICGRCGKAYQLTPDGDYLRKDDCVFHWGRAWKKRVAGQVEARYNCCQGDLSAAGCSVSAYHVSECKPHSALNGYEWTKNWTKYDGACRVYALDCEMVYTTGGNELARVTVVDDRCQVVYERLVKPDNRIVDCNSRFSGLTEAQLNSESTLRLPEVQKEMSTFINQQCILIGHSLESDFRALKLIHDKVVDTSLVFPHRLGAPYKRALKTLSLEFLKKIIQDDIDGHDSKEDATSCIDLMKWRIKQERNA